MKNLIKSTLLPPKQLRVICLTCLIFCTIHNVSAQSTANRQLASLRADIQVIEENNRKLVASVETLSRDNATLYQYIKNLQKTVATLSADNQTLHKELATIRQTLQQEQQARVKMGEQIINTVAGEIKRSASNRTSPQPVAQGEYKVVRGDTLSAIASAFGVSVQALKNVNNLQNDIIREGQKLIIPAQNQ